MKKLILILLVVALGSSCKKKVNHNCDGAELDCAGIMCLLMNYNFDFRIVDKTNGADLVFGNNPRYLAADVQLFYDAAATRPINMHADATAKVFRTIFAKDEIYLVIKGGTPYKLDAEFRVVTCCSQEVSSLSINGQSVCTCCNDVVDIPVN